MQQRATSLIDNWNTMEHLGLISAIHKLGDNNWVAVCNNIKEFFLERPINWFTPESCEAQYKWLHDKCVKLEISCERPSVQIMEYLKTVAKNESYQKEEQERKYKECKKLIETFSKNELDPKVVEDFYENSLKRKKEREENNHKLHEELKKKELSRSELDKSNVLKSPNKPEKTEGNSPVTTSPLLSSLLNNPPAVQYRPTLSTTSFVPSKSVQGSPRITPTDRIQTIADISFKDTYSPDVAVDQPLTFNDRTSNIYGNTVSASRRLNFQESPYSISVVPNQQPSVTGDAINDQTLENEATIKIEESNLENLTSVSANDEYAEIPPDILQVIDKLKVNEVLDKVISQLTSTGDDMIIDANLSTVPIPLDESFINNISKTNEPATTLTDSSQPSISDSDVKTEVEDSISVINDHAVILGEEKPVSGSIEEINTSIEVAESSSMLEIATGSQNSSSFSSLAVSVGCESGSEIKSDSESVEYLDAGAMEDNKSISMQSTENEIHTETAEKVPEEDIKPIDLGNEEEIGTNECEVSEVENNEIDNVSDETKEDGYVTCESTPDKSEMYEDTTKKETEYVSNELEENKLTTEIKTEEVEAAETAIIHENTNERISENTNEKINENTNEKINENTNEKVYENTNEKVCENTVEQVTDSTEVGTTENPLFEVQPEMDIKSEPETYSEKKDYLTGISETGSNNTLVSEQMNDYKEEIFEAGPVETPEAEVDDKESNGLPLERIEKNSIELVASETGPEASSNETKVLSETVIEPIKTDEREACSETSVPDELVRTVETEEEVKSVLTTKNVRKYNRKRRNTLESTENKIPKTVSNTVEEVEDDTVRNTTVHTKELNVAIRDFREDLNPQHTEVLLKPKEEPVEEKLELLEEVLPIEHKTDDIKEEKASPEIKEHKMSPEIKLSKMSPEVKESKSKNKLTRRSALRNQSRISTTEETPTSGSKTPDSAQQALKKRSLVLAHQRLMSLKYSNTFLKPITNKSVPGYEDVIYCPIDLQTIKRKIDNKQISTITEFQRDVLLMINNAKMFNQMHSQVYNMAVEVQREALHDIQLTVQALGEGILLNMNDSSEKTRKRHPIESMKKDQKLTKRNKLSGKDYNTPIKKLKLEEKCGQRQEEKSGQRITSDEFTGI